MPLANFHPAVASWFAKRFGAPTEPQARAWPEIQAGRHTLIAAPTGSGKTLAAFLSAIDDLVRRALIGDGLPDETAVVYVSPLKALSNDVEKNLEEPLAGIRRELAAMGLPDVEIRTQVRTGDTPASARAAMVKRPPHILVTTPESLFILLTSEGGRRMLKNVRTAIVDEIHAVADDKRGSHLSLSLERLEALVGWKRPRLNRVGLSATQSPIEEVARFLVGTANVEPDGTPRCVIVDAGHGRRLDLRIEVPPSSPLEAVMPMEVWAEIYDRLTDLIREHRTTLVFANTRRMAERVTRHLAERLGPEKVMSHHGSLSKEQRLESERRLKAGELSALVATASLELGIDIGSVDLVCQLGSTRSIATLLQRVGRSGHHLGGLPKGRLFPLTRDELIECAALVDAVRRGELDRLIIPERPLDILAQHIVAAVAAPRSWTEDGLFALVRRAWPFRNLERKDFDAIVEMLATGFTTRRGRRGAYLHQDAVNGVLRARKGARLTAVTSGGAIPDLADYQVVLQPAGATIGTVHEDFAVESLAGDVFQLGNASWRIIKVEQGRVLVEDAKGQPPNIPFWLGEAPARTEELSVAVSRLREEVARRVREGSRDEAAAWLEDELGLPPAAASQIVDYLAAAAVALGTMPTRDTLVAERFFDEAGDQHLVLHAPFGSRLNRAWGLALRKRFCRTFNFELQAAATEDAIVLSLGPTHSFPLEDVFHFLSSGTARDVLTQAVLDAPLFGVRWRWNAGRALAIPRQRGGRRVPAPLLRQARRGSGGGRLPRSARLPGEHRGRAGGPGPSADRADPARLPGRGDGHRGAGDAPAADGVRRGRDDRPRRGGALAARPRDPQGPALRLPRRRAAGGAPDAGGLAAPLAGPRDRLGPRRARRRRHRPRARRGLARRRDAGRAARRPADLRLPDGRRGGSLRLGAALRCPGEGPAGHAGDGPRTDRVSGSPPSGSPSSRRSIRR